MTPYGVTSSYEPQCTEDLTLSQTLDIFRLLTLTYPRYVDAASREAVELVGTELIRRDELRGTPEGDVDEIKLGVTEQIVAWLSHEAGLFAKRPGYVPVYRCVGSSLISRPLARILQPTC